MITLRAKTVHRGIYTDTDTHTSTCDVTSGVPQGSVLGPVLFLIYINDIITNIQSEIRLFADDIFLCKTIKTSDDHQILQNDLGSQNGQLTG